MFHYPKKLLVSAMMLSLVACGGGSSGGDDGSGDDGGTTTANVLLKGYVEAINGQLAYRSTSFKDKLLASLFGKSSYAAISESQTVGAGATVELVEVDENGNDMGSVIASGTTGADGSYEIALPDNFTPGPQYIVRAKGNSEAVMARVLSLETDIDPVTDAASSVIAEAQMPLSRLSVTEVEDIETIVADVVESTDADASSGSSFRSSVVTALKESTEASNMVASVISIGQICGTITDSDGTALENIRIIVRDYGDWVTRARAKTDSSGSYCVNVPVAGETDVFTNQSHKGEYILGALNYTNTSYAASQWWTSTSTNADGSGGANTQFKAEKITVSTTDTQTFDMVLDKNGARIEGTVMGDSDGDGVGDVTFEGVRVTVRNYDTFKPLGVVRVKDNGQYRINVKPGDYMLSYRNKTRYPYASEVWRDGTDGVNDRNMASRETVVANTDHTYDVVLDPGVIVSGEVRDNDDNPVSGQVVFFNNADGGRLEALRTNKAGKFRLWVNPRLDLADGTAGAYKIWSRGQQLMANTNGDDDSTPTHYKLSAGTGLAFTAQTIQVKGRLVSADGTQPVASGVLRLDADNGSDAQVSAADGSFVMYTSDTGNTALKLRVRMDDSTEYGSGVYDGSAMSAVSYVDGQAIDGTTADANGVIDLGDIPMPTLGTGSSIGYIEGNAGAGSTGIQLRIGGTGGSNYMVKMRSRGDGSFKFSVPATTYDRLRVFLSGGPNNDGVNCDSLSVSGGNTTTVTVDTSGCTVN